MTNLSFAFRACSVALLALSIAGCSTYGSAGPVPSQGSSARARASGLGVRERVAARTRGWIAPDAKKSKSLIYWADNLDSTVAIFTAGKNPKQKGQISEGLSSPQRLFVDKSRNLYVTNNGYGYVTYGDLTVYAPGTTSPKLTITDGVDNPTGLTVDAAGTIYCANATFPATITEYKAGKSTPSLTIPLQYNPGEYLAIDASDNLYASTLNGSVWKFGPGSTSGTNLNLQIGFGGGLVVDRRGNIVVVDENSAGTIDVFPAGKTVPSKTISVSGFPFALSLSKDEKQLYVTVESGSEFLVQVLKYPGGTTLTTKIGGSVGDWPIAASPDAVL